MVVVWKEHLCAVTKPWGSTLLWRNSGYWSSFFFPFGVNWSWNYRIDYLCHLFKSEYIMQTFFLNHQTSQTVGKNPSTHQNIYKCYFKNKFSLNRRPVSVLCSGILVLLHPSIFLVPAQDWNCFSQLVGFERFWASLLSVLPFWWVFFCLFFFWENGKSGFGLWGFFVHFWAVFAAKQWMSVEVMVEGR